jgi:hypothetical protein
MQLLFEHIVDLPYDLTVEREGAQLAYTPEAVAGIPLWLPAHGLLNEEGIGTPAVEPFEPEGITAFFGTASANALLPFDLPAMTFFLASRYEEYQSFEPDQHGRFPAKASTAYQHGFLRQPLLNQWGLKLAGKLVAAYPQLAVRYPSYAFHPTYDIDLAWAYQERPLWLQLAGIGRDVLKKDWTVLQERWQCLAGSTEDPYHTFSYLEEMHRHYSLSPLYFFLLGDYSKFDKNINPGRPRFQALLRGLAASSATGLHPSYASNQQPAQLEKEAQRYQSITGQPLVRSRQHFLKLRFPATYRSLLALGIEEDYTMGYADEVGFRASLATPFPWYDLEKEQATSLMLYPFALMDGSLRQYMKLSPSEATPVIQQLIAATHAVGGTFLPLWHNSSFSEAHGWGGWREVFEQMLADAAIVFRQGI